MIGIRCVGMVMFGFAVSGVACFVQAHAYLTTEQRNDHAVNHEVTSYPAITAVQLCLTGQDQPQQSQ